MVKIGHDDSLADDALKLNSDDCEADIRTPKSYLVRLLFIGLRTKTLHGNLSKGSNFDRANQKRPY